ERDKRRALPLAVPRDLALRVQQDDSPLLRKGGAGHERRQLSGGTFAAVDDEATLRKAVDPHGRPLPPADAARKVGYVQVGQPCGAPYRAPDRQTELGTDAQAGVLR